MEAQECMTDGLTESRIIPLDDTQKIMDIMDALLKQFARSEIKQS
jgi:hypothetical protein